MDRDRPHGPDRHVIEGGSDQAPKQPPVRSRRNRILGQLIELRAKRKNHQSLDQVFSMVGSAGFEPATDGL